MDLPHNVLEALRERQKIKSIKLLREQRGIGLKEAKDIVDQYLSLGETALSSTKNAVPKKAAERKNKGIFLGILIIATFVWAMINLVEVAGSILVLWHHNNYREATFVIQKVYHNDDYGAGLTWGFIGKIVDSEEEMRMYAPRLADAKALGYQKLRRMYPAGMQLKVLYNPGVTAILFQNRTLRLIPYTSDLIKSESAVIYRWLIYCLLPFVGTLLFARALK